MASTNKTTHTEQHKNMQNTKTQQTFRKNIEIVYTII